MCNRVFGREVLRDLIKRQAKLIARQTAFHLARINGRKLHNCVHNTRYVYKVEALRMPDRLYCRDMKQSRAIVIPIDAFIDQSIRS